MRKKEIAASAVEGLKRLYPDAKCSLLYEKDYELLFATRLSAQCTDARVNIVTRRLFSELRSLEDYINAPIEQIEDIIKSCGLYKTKAKSLKEAAEALVTRFGGRVPDNMEDLLTLSGIGRKTANLILGDIYGKPAVVADTHCIRICSRLGLTSSKDPYKTEIELKKLLDPSESNDFCHRLVLFGRDICSARSPKCDACPLSDFCPKKNLKGGK